MRYSILALAFATSALACASNQTIQGRSTAPAHAYDLVMFDELARTSDKRRETCTKRWSGSARHSSVARVSPRGGNGGVADRRLRNGRLRGGRQRAAVAASRTRCERSVRAPEPSVRSPRQRLRGENVLYVTLLR